MAQTSEAVRVAAFLLLIVGTAGLLLNEFVFGWGRTATLIFAACNVVGLVALARVCLACHVPRRGGDDNRPV